MDQSNILAHSSPQFQARLFLDALERSNRDIARGMWHGHATGFYLVLELSVIALLADFAPSIALKLCNDISAVHYVY
jgi:hypothetical protein